MLDVAIRKPDGSRVVDWQHVGMRTAPPLPVAAALRPVLPGGLRRGSTIAVSGSVSLLLALLGAASGEGAWCALVGFPRISAESAREYGIELRRLAIVPAPDLVPSGWLTAVGALLDAVDIVAARPPRARSSARLAPADVRRLGARARSKDAVLMPFLSGADDAGWPGADVRLHASGATWSGIGEGTGRLRARRLEITASGKGQAARRRSASLWLPAASGGVAEIDRVVENLAAPVIDLAG